MGKYFIGTSGWNYPHWQGVFYPQGLPKKDWFYYYTHTFNSVELNVTFYRTLTNSIFTAWRRKTPKGFYFVVKGPRFITHFNRLRNVESQVESFFKAAEGLKEKLAAVLWQFAPSFKKDTLIFSDFCALLKKYPYPQAFEFRQEGWFVEEVYKILSDFGMCLVIADSGNRFPCVKKIASNWMYLRFHGKEGLYSSCYSDSDLREWADFVADSKARKVFVFFNNDMQGFAVANALRFRELLMKGKTSWVVNE